MPIRTLGLFSNCVSGIWIRNYRVGFGHYRVGFATIVTLNCCLQVAVEGRACVGVAVAQAVRELFLEQEFEPELLPNSLVLALLTKFFKVITSSPLMKGNL